jgi:hypothetical protein
MPNYLVVKVLDPDSIYIPTTLYYESVELRSYKSDNAFEIEALRASSTDHHVNFEHYQVCARIATIVNSASSDDAVMEADAKFALIMDLKFIEFPTSSFNTSGVGFIKDLDSGVIIPIKKPYSNSMSFLMRRHEIQRRDWIHFVLAKNTELKNRYLRSLHWSRHSKHEKNPQLRILFYWFCLEALLKESELDQIGGLLRCFLGFPNWKSKQSLDPSIISVLESHPRYKFWQKKLINDVDSMREFRNNSVHSGFRSMDFTAHDLERYDQIVLLATYRCQSAVLTAILRDIETLSEFKKHAGDILASNANLVNDIHHTVIFTLDKTLR